MSWSAYNNNEVSRAMTCFAGVMIMHNASSYHALPALVSGLHQTMGALSTNGTGPAFVTKSHPLPLTSEESVQLDSLLMVTMRLSTPSSVECSLCKASYPQHDLIWSAQDRRRP